MQRFLLVLLASILVVSYIPSSTGQAAEEDQDITFDTIWEGSNRTIDGGVYIYNGSTLIIRNCTVNTTGIELSDGSTLILDNSTIRSESIEGENSTISIDDCSMISPQGITMVNGSIWVNDSNIYGGVLVWYGALEAYNSTVHGWNLGLAAFGNSTLIADGMDIYDTGVGVWLLWGSGSLSNLTINNTVNGLNIQASTAHVENSILTKNDDGLFILDSFVELNDVVAEDCKLGYGPNLYGTGGKGYGISSWSSTINGSSFTSRTGLIGIYAHDSTIRLDNSTLDDCLTYGIQLESSKFWANDTIFSDNLHAISSWYIENAWWTNTSNWGGNTFFRNDAAFSQIWEVLVNISDTNGNGVRGAMVVASGESSVGHSNNTEVTDFHGISDLSLTTFYIHDNGTQVDYRYDLNIFKEASNSTSLFTYEHSEFLNITMNLERNITLPIVYPDLELWVRSVETSDGSDELRVWLEINNTGQAAAFDVEVKLVEESTTGFKTVIGSDQINISSGETKEVMFLWVGENNSLPEGRYNLIAQVDPEFLVDEENEENNVHERVFEITMDQEGFPTTQILGSLALGAGAILLISLLKRQKPDTGKRV